MQSKVFKHFENQGSFGKRVLAALLGLMCRAVFVGLFWLPVAVHARLGETTIQCIDRYGSPLSDPATRTTETVSPILQGAILRSFVYQGWKIRTAFLSIDGPCVRLEYQKANANSGSLTMNDKEVEAILQANTSPGQKWKRIAYNNPDSPNRGIAKAGEAFFAVGQKMWQRSDSARAWLRSDLILRLELPAALAHERKLKEKKTSQSLPQF